MRLPGKDEKDAGVLGVSRLREVSVCASSVEVEFGIEPAQAGFTVIFSPEEKCM